MKNRPGVLEKSSKKKNNIYKNKKPKNNNKVFLWSKRKTLIRRIENCRERINLRIFIYLFNYLWGLYVLLPKPSIVSSIFARFICQSIVCTNRSEIWAHDHEFIFLITQHFYKNSFLYKKHSRDLRWKPCLHWLFIFVNCCKEWQYSREDLFQIAWIQRGSKLENLYSISSGYSLFFAVSNRVIR